MDGDTTFGAWLKSRRRQLDLTQKGLAHQVGCSVGTIRKMESDERRPSRQLAGLLAECLEIPQDQSEVFIAFARSEAYISETPLPVLPAEDQILVIPQETKEPKIKHNLPLVTTPFVGREAELDALDELLAHHERRLLTILGSGGIGKTRLGIACAERQLQRQDGSQTHPYKDGIYFVDLAPMKDAERLVFRLAETLNLRIQAGARENRSPMQQVLDFLRGRHLLLVLDNFEHLLSPARLTEDGSDINGATLVAEILGTAPQVRILVTSRERLNLHIEQVYPIQGLMFPDWEIPEDAVEYSAIKLFIQTAQSVQPDFMVAEDDLPHLTQICRMVEGMPLGLELAAAWVDVLSLVDIAAEIQQSLDFLETEMRDVPDRHRSMRATFDSSWRKLDEKEQSIFTQLSIFQGGFTREAAKAVTGVTLRQLARLVNKSFIQFNHQRDRYQVHELLRQYGAEHLSWDCKLELDLQGRHRAYYCHFLADYTEEQKGAGQQQALIAIEADIENVWLAWDYAIYQQKLDAIEISIESLFRFYWNNFWFVQGVKEFEKAVAVLRTGQPVRERGIVLGCALAFLGRFYGETGQTDRDMETFQESLDLMGRLGARKERLIPLLFLASRRGLPIAESTSLFHESLALAREFGDEWAVGHALFYLGMNYHRTGEYEQAGERYQEALVQFRHNQDSGGIIATTCFLSNLAVDRGHYQHALSLAQDCMMLIRDDIPKFSIFGLDSLGVAMQALGLYGEAKNQIQQGLKLIQDGGFRSWIPLWRFRLGEVNFEKGDYIRAERQFQKSLELAFEFDQLDLGALNHNVLGRLYLVDNNYLKVREHLQAALEIAIPLGRPPLLLAIFVTFAELISKEKNLEQVALLANYVTKHKASAARVKERAEGLLTRLKAQLSADDMAAIRQRSQECDLESLAAQLVNELAG